MRREFVLLYTALNIVLLAILSIYIAMLIIPLLLCRNGADLSRNTQAPTTATNPAYELMKQGDGNKGCDYELVNVSPGADLHITKTEPKAYEIPALPPSHGSLPAIPTVEDVDVAREVKAEIVYDSTPGDQ